MPVSITKTESFEIPDAAIAAMVDAYLAANPPGAVQPFDGDAGEYTPTLSNVANGSSLVPHPLKWMRIKDMVYAAGNVDFAGSSLTTISMSLPIASNFTDTNGAELSGMLGNTDRAGQIVGDPVNDCAILYIKPANSVAARYSISFMYKVI